jgi:hypothetical protein
MTNPGFCVCFPAAPNVLLMISEAFGSRTSTFSVNPSGLDESERCSTTLFAISKNLLIPDSVKKFLPLEDFV